MIRIPTILVSVAVFVAGAPGELAAHGGVAFEDDQCVINIGYLQAHFKIYLPEKRGHEQFCEDLPVAGHGVFVMEYTRPGLDEVPIDFRIVRNVTGLDRFADEAAVRAIPDLDAVSVMHLPPAPHPGVFTAQHVFEQEDAYIGIVTARLPGSAQNQVAVFPFRVGRQGPGPWAWLLLVAAVAQLGVWLASGRLTEWRQRRAVSRA